MLSCGVPRHRQLEEGLQLDAVNLRPKAVDVYRSKVAAGTYLELIVRQRGADVELVLVGPTGSVLRSVDSPTGEVGIERMVWITDRDGRFEVHVEHIGTARGQYDLEVVALRPADARDHETDRAEANYLRGIALRRDGDFDAAVPVLTEAQRAFAALGDPRREAEASYERGRCERDGSGRRAEGVARAINSFSRAAEGFAAAGDKRLQLHALNQVADLNRVLGRSRAHEVAIQHAIEVARTTAGASLEFAIALNNRGVWRLDQRRLASARIDFERAIEMLSGAPPALWFEATLRGNLCALEIAQGTISAAVSVCSRANEVGMEAEVPARTARLHLALAHGLEGRTDLALEQLTQAISDYRASDARPRALAEALNIRGFLLQEIGRLDEAQSTLDEAFRTAPEGAFIRGPIALNLGYVYLSDGALDRAGAWFKRSDDLGRQRSAALGQAYVARARGDVTVALMLAERALGLDSDDTLDDPKQRLSAAGERDALALVADLLLDLDRREPGAGHDWRALVFEDLRRTERASRRLEQARRQDAADPLAIDAVANERLREEAVEAQRQWNADVRNHRSPPPELRSKIHRLERELDAAEAGPPGFGISERAQLADGPDIGPRLLESLDAEEILLAFALDRRPARLWAIDRDGLEVFRLDDRNWRRDVEAVRRVVTDGRGVEPGQPDRWLAEDLLRPVAHELRDKHLVIVPDTATLGLPFGALARYAAERHGRPRSVTQVPSIGVHFALRAKRARAPAYDAIAILANPEYRQTPATEATGPGRLPREGLPLPLPASALEAADIASRYPDDRVLLLTGADASRANVLEAALTDRRVLHLAVHAVLRPPPMSLLLASNHGHAFDRLGVRDVERLRLRADLVVLSACSSALGPRRTAADWRHGHVTGSGLFGLAQAFLHAGATCVVGSIDKVGDIETADFMAKFYDYLLIEMLDPAESLARMREDLWTGPSSNLVPFIAIGDCRRPIRASE